MDRGIRSMATFTFGVVVVAIGLTAAVADGTDLGWASTASVAALGAAVVILVAAVMAPRIDGNRGRGQSAPPGPKPESTEAGSSSETESLSEAESAEARSSEPQTLEAGLSEPLSLEDESSWESAFGVEPDVEASPGGDSNPGLDPKPSE